MNFFIPFFVIDFVCVVTSEGPPGHLQPIGNHRPGIKVEERLTVPDPVEFYEKYVRVEKPVVFKGAAKKFPNFETWKDDTYLRSKYSNFVSIVDIGKYEGSVFGKSILIPLRNFLNHYKTKNYYMVQDISPKNPMRNDIFLLKAMSCGGYQNTINKVVLLFSYGGTECALHWDDVDNIHCIMDGTKEWKMLESKASETLPTMKDYPAYSEFDCRSIDMYKYPMVQNLSWYHAMLETGDCLYVPPKWPHYVKSPPNRRNMGLAIWSGPVLHFNRTDCPKDLSKLPDVLPIGKRFITKLEHAKLAISKVFGHSLAEIKKDLLTKEFTEYLQNITAAQIATNALDADKDGFVTRVEVSNMREKHHSFFTSLFEIPYTSYAELDENWTSHVHVGL